jgi:hypothetical protein
MSDAPENGDEDAEREAPDRTADGRTDERAVEPPGGEEPERPETGDEGGAGREPLSDLADRVRQSRSRREGGQEPRDEADPFAALERTVEESDTETDETDPFEQMEVGDVDEEAVWESLEGEEAAAADQPSVGAGADAERVERDDPGAERPDHVVEKSAYCQRCQFFSAPPEVRCTHEGTAIVEVVDSERFRVRGCPMVAEGGAVDRDPDRDRHREDA